MNFNLLILFYVERKEKNEDFSIQNYVCTCRLINIKFEKSVYCIPKLRLKIKY